MGYQLRLHDRVHDWLADLRGAEPELARLVGEAVLAMLEAAGSLGPPLVVPLESVLRPPDDPREALDYSYQRQLEALTKVRRGVADVATSRKRVELQAAQLEQTAAKLASQRQAALDAGQDNLASQARDREAAIRDQLADLRRQLAVLQGEEERLTVASQRLQAKVDAFRTHKEAFTASYTARQASRTAREAFSGIGEDTSGPGETDAAADPSSWAVSSPAAAEEVLEEISDFLRTVQGGFTAADKSGVTPPPGLMELRPGAPGPARVGLLFVVEPQDTVVVVAWTEHPGGSPDHYQQVLRLATARLATAQSGGTATPAATPGAFISYDAESFLDEFFPGQAIEVEIGAAALIARHRAHTLVQARQRLGLTQEQVASRMNVRPGRVSAIERAEPGATEVRTLASYVQALGGRLEIIADVGGERIRLR